MKKPYIYLLAILFGCFLAFGLWLNQELISSGAKEVFGYDYCLFMNQMRDMRWITYTGARHPGLGIVMSPVVLIANNLNSIHPGICDVFLLGITALTVTMSVWLVKLIAGWAAFVIFISFGFVWVLAAVPESFPLAMLSLLLTVWYCKKVLTRHCEYPIGNWVWFALFLFCSGITITNGLKVLVAYVICNWPMLVKRRKMQWGEIRPITVLGFGIAAFVMFGVGFFALRMALWNMNHPESVKTASAAISQTLSWIPEDLGVWGRLHGFAVNFLTVPVVSRFAFSDIVHPGHPSMGWMLWAGVLFLLCGLSVIRNRESKIVHVLLGMFSIDLLIHIVCGWGLAEGWIFCAHWFWMMPILVVMLFKKDLP